MPYCLDHYRQPMYQKSSKYGLIAMMSAMWSHSNLDISHQLLNAKQGHFELPLHMSIICVDAWFHFYCEAEHLNSTSLFTNIQKVYA